MPSGDGSGSMIGTTEIDRLQRPGRHVFRHGAEFQILRREILRVRSIVGSALFVWRGRSGRLQLRLIVRAARLFQLNMF